MPKKLKPRKFNYIFSDNTEEENFRVKKEFTEAVRDIFFKKNIKERRVIKTMFKKADTQVLKS